MPTMSSTPNSTPIFEDTAVSGVVMRSMSRQPVRGQTGAIRWQHTSGTQDFWSALVMFPLALRDDSGVAHVLEHTICTARSAEGPSCVDLGYWLSDLNFNARTESDHLSFYFTCRSEETFVEAMRTLLHAAYRAEIREEDFRREAFTFEPTQEDSCGFRVGGTVYSEMSDAWMAPSRAFDSATLKGLYPDRSWHFDPGGDPRLIRRLRHADLLAMRSKAIHAENCTILVASPASNIDLCQLLGPYANGNQSLRARDSGSRYLRTTSATLAPHPVGERRFRRFAVEIGRQTCAQELVASWILEFATRSFSPAFEALAQKLGARFEPTLSGSLNLAPRLVFAVTFSAERPGKPITREITALIRYMLAHLRPMDMGPWLTQRQLDLREILRPHDSGSVANLQWWARSLLDGEDAAFPQLSDDVRGIVEGILKPGGLERWGAEHLAFSEVREITLAGSSTAGKKHASAEQRLMSRLQKLKFRRSASPWTAAANPPARFSNRAASSTAVRCSGDAPLLDTGGVNYVHEVLNVSNLSQRERILLPLALARIEHEVRIHGDPLKSYLFAHASQSGESILLVSFKIRYLSEDVDRVDAIRRALQALANDDRSPGQVNPAWIALARDATDGSPMHLALSQSSWQRAVASEAVRQWRGVEQMKFLSAASGQQSPSLASEIDALCRNLLQVPFRRLNVGSGKSRDQILEAAAIDLQLPLWPRAPQSVVTENPGSPRMLLTGKRTESVLARRTALDLKRLEQAASLLVLGPSVEAECLQPTIRDRLGAYGSSFGVDLATMEAYLAVQQFSAFGDTVRAIDEMLPSAALRRMTNGDFFELRRRVLGRLQSQESPVNATIGDFYNRSTGTTLAPLAECVMALERTTAMQWLDATFADPGAVWTAYQPRQRQLPENGVWSVTALDPE